ncbi:MAG: PIN domain-containing protein [Nitrospirae bacterium]|nr:PIN domain-containing protein [Candidatus Troglogloeales bacterium]
MFVVDTNVLIYAADRNASEHKKCQHLLTMWRKGETPWHLTWGIVYEFLRVSTHPRVFQHPLSAASAWSFLRALFSTPGMTILTETNRHAQTADEVFHEVPLLSGNLFFDAHTVVLMREHGLKRIYTRDADFHRFRQIEVIDPLK